MVMKKTFKEFLMEFDRSDIALQQQHAGTLQQGAPRSQAPQQAAPDFKGQMASKAPQKGDIIQTAAGRFLVRGGSMEGTMVKQIGGMGKEITVPHQTKFKLAGTNENGANVWEVVK
jgi:hypothetical protein